MLIVKCIIVAVQLLSHIQLFDPVDCSMLGSSVLHYLLEFAQICVYWIVVQSLSLAWLLATPWAAALQASQSFTISWSLFRLISIESVMLSNHLILCHLLLLPSIFPSIRVFSSGSAFPIRWPNFGASALALVLPMSIQGWFPLGLTGLISLLSKGLSGVFCRTTIGKHQFFRAQPSLWSNSHIHPWLLEKP